MGSSDAVNNLLCRERKENTILGAAPFINWVKSCNKYRFLFALLVFGVLCWLSVRLTRSEGVYSGGAVVSVDLVVGYFQPKGNADFSGHYYLVIHNKTTKVLNITLGNDRYVVDDVGARISAIRERLEGDFILKEPTVLSQSEFDPVVKSRFPLRLNPSDSFMIKLGVSGVRPVEGDFFFTFDAVINGESNKISVPIVVHRLESRVKRR